MMSHPVASLGMYDHAGQQWANDAIWSRIAAILNERGVAAPSSLDRARPVEHVWRDPGLLLGQACGYPLVSQPGLSLRVIALPHYDVPECRPGEHVSVIVTRRSETSHVLAGYRDRTAAINTRHSNTGHNLFRAEVAPLAKDGRFLGDVIETGSHRASIAALLQDKADIAAIDAVSLAAIERYEPGVTELLRVIATTRSSATPPFVTARSTDDATVAVLRDALATVSTDPRLAGARHALFLTGIVAATIEPYAILTTYEEEAIAAAYPQLA